jgi:hypothetical protein
MDKTKLSAINISEEFEDFPQGLEKPYWLAQVVWVNDEGLYEGKDIARDERFDVLLTKISEWLNSHGINFLPINTNEDLG